ncbi:hypothetical protein [Halolamina rubra]|uniref:hypothetical protein n=1 Tax=Halolamina rubra TaxID=1380430 RepID=UPI0012ABA682|nr:hypothetical protein [Halolamina rubra]
MTDSTRLDGTDSVDVADRGTMVNRWGGARWTPTGQNLKSVRRGETEIAVGAAGTVIEK